MMTENIGTRIENAKLSSDLNPLSGDCAGVAAGIRDVFGGKYVAVYSSKSNADNELPAHVAVKINGDIYDGTGKLTKQDLFEIHLVINGDVDENENPDDYILYESPPDYMISDSVREETRERLSIHP